MHHRFTLHEKMMRIRTVFPEIMTPYRAVPVQPLNHRGVHLTGDSDNQRTRGIHRITYCYIIMRPRTNFPKIVAHSQ